MKQRTNRLPPAERKKEILEGAINVAIRIGHLSLTRADVAHECKITPSLIAKYFRTIELLRRAVLNRAIKLEILPILAHCVYINNHKFSPSLRDKIIKHLHTR